MSATIDPSDVPELDRLIRLAKLENVESGSFPLSDVTLLNLTGAQLSSLPASFPQAFPNLSILFLSNNQFVEMPAVIGQCSKLQMVAFKSNGMTSIHPDALQAQLRWLILTDNGLTQLPDTIGRCVRLQKCMLSGNRLTYLPDSMKNCQNLELIRLASNQLTEPPVVLLQELPRLSWVALSDNPFLNETLSRQNDELPVLTDLEEDPEATILGQGASGITRQQDYQGRPVAVKTYNTQATVTSDGLPDEERKINCAVARFQQSSPALIQVLGQTATTGSLVMELLQNYVALGNPPTFDSCSRDVYPPSLPVHQIGNEQALGMVTDLLTSLRLLHQRGICHGDFYSHNILVYDNSKSEGNSSSDDQQQVKLSDFGAAFFYDKKAKYGALIEQIELRAFGVWVSEMFQHIPGPITVLNGLVEACRQEGSNFESVFVWWKQQQLAQMAEAFGGADLDRIGQEEKEIL